MNWFNCCIFRMRPEVVSQHDHLLPHPISLGILAIGIVLNDMDICIRLYVCLVLLDISNAGFHPCLFYNKNNHNLSNLSYPSLQQPWFLGRLKPGGNHPFWQAIQDLKLILKSIINLKIQKTRINLFSIFWKIYIS